MNQRVEPTSLLASETTRREVPYPPRLLMVSSSYWPEPTGGAPMMAELATWFAAQGCAMTVLTARPNYPEMRIFPGYEDGAQDSRVVDGVRIERLPTIPATGGGAKARFVFESTLMMQALKALAGRRVARADAVVSLSPTILMVLAASAARRPGGRHLAIVHDVQSGLADALKMGGRLGRAVVRTLRAVERTALNRADAIVVLSEPMRTVLRDLGVTRPIEVIPPHVDTHRIYPLGRPEGWPPTVLYSGNFGRKQGLEQVLALAEILRDRRPEARVVLRGAGPLEETLKREAVSRGLANTHVEPLLPPDLFNQGLAEGDIHLVPQKPEGAAFAMPGKAITIMAAGRPFVCTALPGGTLHALGESTQAFLSVPPDDIRALADAVVSLLDDPERRAAMGRRGRTWVEHNASRHVVMERYARLLTGPASEGGKG